MGEVRLGRNPGIGREVPCGRKVSGQEMPKNPKLRALLDQERTGTKPTPEPRERLLQGLCRDAQKGHEPRCQRFMP